MKFYNPFNPPPAPPGFGAGKIVPEKTASWPSRLFLHWLGAFLNVGYSRPLMSDDFWELPEHRHTAAITNEVEANFYARCPPEKRPPFMRDSKSEEEETEKNSEPEKGEDIEGTPAATGQQPVYDQSLFKALHKTFFRRIWSSAFLLLASETLRTTTPLLNKVFITWLSESYVYARLSDADRDAAASLGFFKPRGVGYGIGLAFALFAMQESASLMDNHFSLIGMTTGLYVRTGVVGNIFRKSLRLSGKARAEHSVGQITTMISTDATHLDMFSAFAHHLWSAPIQVTLGIGLLIGNLGYSALVGLGVIIVTLPIQTVLIVIMMRQTKKGVQIKDKHIRLTTEVLQGIRLIKVYGWEAFYTQQITKYREGEIKTIRAVSVVTALLFALFTFVPILATVLSFITYALTGHDLNVAIIFTSLQLFNIIRIPMIIFPFVLSSLAEFMVSTKRISTFLVAEELADPYRIEPTSTLAVQVDGDFEWETVLGLEKKPKDKESEDKDNKKVDDAKKAEEKSHSGWWKRKKGPASEQVLPVVSEKEKSSTEVEPEPEEKPFGLKDLHLEIPKGSFVAIVGRVGCGKSSILQALIGEMKRTRGSVIFGGSVAYVPQAPWIKNATLRDNILFGEPDDDKRFQQVIHACSLEHDLSILPQADRTQIGEKGINLSGGQKARVSLARAAYSRREIVLLDDPLSAVDAYVGKNILDNCILDGPLSKRTRILVTHALRVLDKTDYIYVMDNGKIIEQGTYSDLTANSPVFSRLIEDYGKTDTSSRSSTTTGGQVGQGKTGDASDVDDTLMQLEERLTGAVSWKVYTNYLRKAGGLAWAPIILSLLIINEAAQVGTTLFLGFWSGNTIPHFTQGRYMAVYAGIGSALAMFTFCLTYAFVIMGLNASLNLYKSALAGVLDSPVSFFDTTPIGRILSRLSKDQDTIDNELPLIFMQFLTTLASVFGTIGLVFYTFPYLGIIFVPLTTLYYWASVYYRRSSVETKRLDSLLRSVLYGSYSETLTGLSTIRAYRMQPRSIEAADRGLDGQNRAYLMTLVMQRWLAIRLDMFGNILVLGIAIFGATFRTSVNPARVGVVLTYTLGITQIFSPAAEMINFFAQTEQNMNAVERVLHYAELPSEGDESKTEPPASWPHEGAIKFRNVRLTYREGLPFVLKGVDFDVRPGEKIGIVGRTGSGKSSLIQALFRTVELREGKIEVDGYDISQLGLHFLRTRLAFVPQDTTLFLGTLRDNLDPQRLRTDAELISVLQRAWLLPKEGPVDPAIEAKFGLDSIVGDEGSNYSAGEKQLLALSRALVKNSRIIILDEATSNVDAETDSKVQRTIQTEFASSTLLCIAHRLNTIAHYDRILVMNDGLVAEFDTVLNLFDKHDSIFRSLCNEANLTRTDIMKLRTEHTTET
ncbi:hypothetical protein NLJ89_g715 [Agrocybe chaxingu]|uniref:Multidrug resistance-associated ABC transporter n=1 Tax=Agrocybe chaxingu TaxID=84603 RepID=A0A9W8TFM7_9AGAR|nr:hypothetical protein NLJ89_g715 [Agrocybe chaxingu]